MNNMIKGRFRGKTRYLEKKTVIKTVKFKMQGFYLKEPPFFVKKQKNKNKTIFLQACYRKETAF